ncbi:tyrosine-type recombinase/integrase [Alcaligenes sp. SDU_A2]|uniref:tyrosine-type recombinase/integrase n=1 Tax=Alcaligenes sp. SDU_A2 TaxID=3136634 RepID=UPI00311E7CC4
MIASRKKNRHLGLLPRMDARKRKGGGYTYRYLTYDRRYINLGHDRAEAIKRVLEMEQRAPDTGTVTELLREYFRSSNFKNDISPRTQQDYLGYSKQILRVFGQMQASDILPPHIARYLRIERASAPSQANKEVAMLSSAFQFGIEAGIAIKNPCREVRKNKERPRTRCPSWEEIESFCLTAKAKGPSSHVIGLMAKFIALTGRRRAEFINMKKADLTPDGIRVTYAKGRVDDPEKRGLIEWTDSLRAILTELKAIERPGAISSVYLWTNRSGKPYTEQGFKAMWAKIMADWAKDGQDRFTFHDLRAYYVTRMVERNQNPETHSNPATTRKVYDRRRVVRIKTSA